jgi:hypothetical protein
VDAQPSVMLFAVFLELSNKEHHLYHEQQIWRERQKLSRASL